MSLTLDLRLQREGLRPPITSRQLLDLAQECHERWPAGRLFKNRNGNLAVDVDGQFAGWIDLASAGLIGVVSSQPARRSNMELPSFVTVLSRTGTSARAWCDECDFGSNGFVSPREAFDWAYGHVATRHPPT